ncbi:MULTISPECIES: HAD-IIIA family hydrolase [Microbacterium]|uniref:D-glycero-alpha-D-manno-heptose-1,7-bisphosphate 7-phosphatase n=1 Tax=Microbacterium TaxID=33882 RepID=UPI002784E2CD|nr:MULTISPECIES: HAD-IIIA family hydrolase [Microbacterium]MDQ1083253.1 D-glycero-D-manno-heptose 1,7-bisphosphate phosphatase [Microbacterium sp. SORGH_AS_0344]MDQ1171469.1 D-glycero-D-manno-heptose 1,7-bisphosphate phosphatase [Microbacterium proteolyticum]
MVSPPVLEPADENTGTDWCLFLDRDGVINTRIMGGYVRSWSEFAFAPGALDALAVLAAWAPRIVVVTNQQGVGKGLMSGDDLAAIHGRMTQAIAAAGGRIDAVEVCPHLDAAQCPCRKPQPGMATRYLRAHPEVLGSASVMVGDTESDIEMGRRLGTLTGGCRTVRIGPGVDPRADETFPDLAAFAASLRIARRA